MQKMMIAFLICLPALLLSGCATSVLTNLTTTTQARNPTGQYLVELQMDTSMQTMRSQTVTPYAVVKFNEYKMRPTLRTSNRWETYIPVPPDQDYVFYHFKVDYDYNKFGKPGQGSKLSQQYRLDIK